MLLKLIFCKNVKSLFIFSLLNRGNKICYSQVGMGLEIKKVINKNNK